MVCILLKWNFEEEDGPSMALVKVMGNPIGLISRNYLLVIPILKKILPLMTRIGLKRLICLKKKRGKIISLVVRFGKIPRIQCQRKSVSLLWEIILIPNRKRA